MRFGFSFPKEHGLIAIWSATLIFGLIMGIADSSGIRIIFGIIVSLIFSFTIILSYETMTSTVKSKFTKINIAPLLTLGLVSLFVLLWNLNTYSIRFFLLLFVIVILWVITAIFTNNLYAQLILGSLAISLQYPIIYNIFNEISDIQHYVHTIVTWWIYSSVVIILIVHVGCYRGKIKHNIPLYIWIGYSLSFLPLFITGILRPIALILLIEPSIRVIKQAIKRQTMKDLKRGIRKIGWEMVIGLYTFIIIVFIMALLNIRFTAVI